MNWPSGKIERNETWWKLPHDERQTVLEAIEALGVDATSVFAIDFGDNAATFTLFHVTNEAGRAHLEGHCEGEPAWRTGSDSRACTCGREVGDSHPTCMRVETVSYPA